MSVLTSCLAVDMGVSSWCCLLSPLAQPALEVSVVLGSRGGISWDESGVDFLNLSQTSIKAWFQREAEIQTSSYFTQNNSPSPKLTCFSSDGESEIPFLFCFSAAEIPNIPILWAPERGKQHLQFQLIISKLILCWFFVFCFNHQKQLSGSFFPFVWFPCGFA